MRHYQIQCNFGGTDNLRKLGEEYLIALTCKLRTSFWINYETFDILHAFLSLVIAKLSDLENSPVFWTTLYRQLNVHKTANNIAYIVRCMLVFLFDFSRPISTVTFCCTRTTSISGKWNYLNELKSTGIISLISW